MQGCTEIPLIIDDRNSPLPTLDSTRLLARAERAPGRVGGDGHRQPAVHDHQFRAAAIGQLQVWADRVGVPGQAGFALDAAEQLLPWFNDYFGTPYPLPKLDQIASPIMPGAMENAGADLYADSILVMDDKASTAQKRTFGMVVAHELAHQWFGDYVTCKDWSHIWLNEGFAT